MPILFPSPTTLGVLPRKIRLKGKPRLILSLPTSLYDDLTNFCFFIIKLFHLKPVHISYTTDAEKTIFNKWYIYLFPQSQDIMFL